MVSNIRKRGATHRIVNEQIMSIRKPMFDGAANDACTDDSDLPISANQPEVISLPNSMTSEM